MWTILANGFYSGRDTRAIDQTDHCAHRLRGGNHCIAIGF